MKDLRLIRKGTFKIDSHLSDGLVVLGILLATTFITSLVGLGLLGRIVELLEQFVSILS